MSREIKFRAWVEVDETHKMIDWNSLHLEKDECGLMLWVGDDGTNHFGNATGESEFKLMQYTGLKDENGQEIYEGDILGSTGEMPLLVECSKDHAAFVFVDKFDPPGDTIYTINCISWGGFEVIGNVYENPELLDWKRWEALK